MNKGDKKPRETKVFARNQTYHLLRKKLLLGLFRPNQRLTEEFLAKELDVSRTPVREALHKLELEGLVKPAGKRGYCAPEESLKDICELFEIRAIMEGYALASIIENISRKELQNLKIVVQQAEDAFREKNLSSIFDYNTRFHDMLYSSLSTAKPRLYSMIEDIREYTLRYRKDTLLYRKGVQRSIEGHKKILLALDTGDPALCEQIMRKHVYEARDDTLASLRERNHDQDVIEQDIQLRFKEL